ncbi:hypothetical protein AAEX37_00513 [Oligella sp. MSHR50489EDL]|uniref:hypothetical protein n=1 Tax=Oligella sp. MSHR50489EDL TaxID=3139409 RepID=UPI003D8178AB
MNTLHLQNKIANETDQTQGLVWNMDLSLETEFNAAALKRRQAIEQSRASRLQTAHIEREIMIAVVILYTMILGSFAALHLYGHFVVADQSEQIEQTEVKHE